MWIVVQLMPDNTWRVLITEGDEPTLYTNLEQARAVLEDFLQDPEFPGCAIIRVAPA